MFVSLLPCIPVVFVYIFLVLWSVKSNKILTSFLGTLYSIVHTLVHQLSYIGIRILQYNPFLHRSNSPHQTQHITFKHKNCPSILTISTKIITRYTTSLSNLPSPHFCTIQQSLSNSFSSSNPKNKQICQPQSKHHCQLQLSKINNTISK